MTDMIAAEPALSRRMLAALSTSGSPADRLARAITDAVGARQPMIVTGCGTSEHGAIGFAGVVADAVVRATGDAQAGLRVVSAQAFELALSPPSQGLVIGISHEGGTWATNLAVERARAAGARTAFVTAGAGSPGAALAQPDLLLTTGEMDASWCHTVGYLSPLIAAVAVAGRLAPPAIEPDAARALVAAGAGEATAATAELIAGRLAGARRIVVIASGADRAAGRELVLKIEEATWIPSAYRDLETLLHGHLPALGAEDGLVHILADRSAGSERRERARQALAAVEAVGIPAAAILTESHAAGLDHHLTPAGRLTVPDAPAVPAPIAALLASATALQLLTERLARARGTNPDGIRRDDPRYLEAATRVE